MTTLTATLRAGRVWCWTAALWCAGASAQAQQAPDAASGLGQFSGFATLALNHQDNATVAVISNFAQTRAVQRGWSGHMDSVLGLQYQWQPSAWLGVVAQGVARADKDFRPDLRMAHVRAQWGQDLSLRAGRVRSPVYFDSDVDEIGYAYLMMRAPLTLYGPSKAAASLDGGDVQWRQRVGPASVVAQVHGGRMRFSQPLPALPEVFAENEVGEHKLGRIGGVALSLVMPDVTLRAARTWSDRYTFRSDTVTQLNDGVAQIVAGLSGAAALPFLPPALAEPLRQKAQVVGGFASVFDGRVVYSSLGLDGTFGDWRVLGEWLELRLTAPIVGTHQGYHLTLGRNWGDLTPYVSLARQRRTTAPLNTSGLAPTGLSPVLDNGLGQLKANLDAVSRKNDYSMKSISLGARYDFRDRMALKVQLDRMKAIGSNGSEGFFQANRRPFDPVVHLFSVGLDLAF
jgi:hypothetical protein